MAGCFPILFIIGFFSNYFNNWEEELAILPEFSVCKGFSDFELARNLPGICPFGVNLPVFWAGSVNSGRLGAGSGRVQ